MSDGFNFACLDIGLSITGLLLLYVWLGWREEGCIHHTLTLLNILLIPFIDAIMLFHTVLNILGHAIIIYSLCHRYYDYVRGLSHQGCLCGEVDA